MPYINTVDINGVIYNLGNLKDDDGYIVNLPDLTKDDTFILQGDIVNDLNTEQSNKPLSARQGSVLNKKDEDLQNQITTLSGQSDDRFTSLGGRIDSLTTDMTTKDGETLSSAKSYSDTKCSETLASANKHTDDSCATINTTITALQKTVQDNKTSVDSDVSDLRDYANNTFIEKTKIADNLTTNSSEQILSAKQGKALNDGKLNISGGTMTGNINMNHHGINNIGYMEVVADAQTEGVKLRSSGTADAPVLEIGGTQGDEAAIVRGLANPVEDTDAANKKFVLDSITSGSDGATFTPSVSSEGILSWTNDKGKANPASVNIRGKDGDPLSVLAAYPVGAIYISVSSTNPQTLFGGTWEQIQGRFLLAADSTYKAGSTGGEASVTLIREQLPTAAWASGDGTNAKAGSITGTTDTGYGAWTQADNWGQPHNNMPPYLAVYMWKRTK